MPLHPDDGNLAALAAYERATDPTPIERRYTELLDDGLSDLIAGLDRETLNAAIWCLSLPRNHRYHDATAVSRLLDEAAWDQAQLEHETDIERDLEARQERLGFEDNERCDRIWEAERQAETA